MQTVLNFPYASHINNKQKQNIMQKGVNWRLNKHTEIIQNAFIESGMNYNFSNVFISTLLSSSANPTLQLPLHAQYMLPKSLI